MGTNSFLDQLLKTGAEALAGAKAKVGEARASGDFDKYATGAAVGGVLGLLLGTGRGRSISGKLLKVGSVAAIGGLAWKAYQDYHASRATMPGGSAAADIAVPKPFEALPAPEKEQHGRAMLQAMISAAKSDGHLDDRELGLLQTELERTQADAGTRAWVQQRMTRPADAAAVARQAETPQMAAEIYLASLLVVDERSTLEREYLEALARELRLQPELKASLEARAAAG
jgi:uncharacterized membrane protein YebE (DUF533 family)